MSIVVLLATALAAGVEWVEALTIVLAVGLVKGWRSAFAGAALALIALIALVAAFGITITSKISITSARTVVGVFLLLFGLKWLHKAILRSSGLKALHDEAASFDEVEEMLRASGGSLARVDRVGVTTSFGGVFLEGLEVVFIVVALGGLQDIPSAAIGAGVALLIVSGAGAAFRHPLTRVPENTMKYVVGIMLTSFGTFFAGEGIGVHWWGDDLSLLVLIAVYGLASLAFVQLLRRPAGPPRVRRGLAAAVRAVALELWGLFVDDGAVAVGAVVALLAVALLVNHVGDQHALAGGLLVVGVLVAVGAGLWNALRTRRGATRTSASPHVEQAAAADPSDRTLVAPRADS